MVLVTVMVSRATLSPSLSPHLPSFSTALMRFFFFANSLGPPGLWLEAWVRHPDPVHQQGGSMDMWRALTSLQTVLGQFGTRKFGIRTIWHQDNLAPRQFGTRTIWHRRQSGTADNLASQTIWHNGKFGTGKFGTRTICHHG